MVGWYIFCLKTEITSDVAEYRIPDISETIFVFWPFTIRTWMSGKKITFTCWTIWPLKSVVFSHMLNYKTILCLFIYSGRLEHQQIITNCPYFSEELCTGKNVSLPEWCTLDDVLSQTEVITRIAAIFCPYLNGRSSTGPALVHRHVHCLCTGTIPSNLNVQI